MPPVRTRYIGKLLTGLGFHHTRSVGVTNHVIPISAPQSTSFSSQSRYTFERLFSLLVFLSICDDSQSRALVDQGVHGITALIIGLDYSTFSEPLQINVLHKSCISVHFIILMKLVSMWLSSLCKDSPRFYQSLWGYIRFFRFISERYAVATRSGI